jgi:hypothetical protein
MLFMPGGLAQKLKNVSLVDGYSIMLDVLLQTHIDRALL